MLIDLKPIISSFEKEVHKEVLIEQESFNSKIGNFPITKKTPLNLTIHYKELQKLAIAAEADLTLTANCDRCLDEVPLNLHLEILREFVVEDKELIDGEITDADYIVGCSLDTDKLVYDELLLRWPAKIICRKDCKGICPKCGCNLNSEECACDKTVLDPRMAAIQDVFNKFKEV